MPTTFTLDQKLIGYAASTAAPGEKVQVRYRELIGPEDLHLQRQLDNLQNSLFCKIPGLPTPSVLDHLLVVIRPDMACTAYFNELNILAQARTTRTVENGAPVYLSDIGDITSVKLGVEIPDDCGVVLVRSTGWRRSLFFDFGPLLPAAEKRTFALEQMLAKQALLLLGLPSGLPEELQARQSGEYAELPTRRLPEMAAGLDSLRSLLSNKCEEESKYQEVLQEHPWMLGGLYSVVIRHQKLDDANIPDFTAVRCYDGCHDIVELKQPFTPLFKKDGDFSLTFNDAWNQAERYLMFAIEQRSYLRDEKELRFETPRCLLIVGHGLKEKQLRQIRRKETLVRSISVLTYDHLAEIALNVLSLMEAANRLTVDTTGQGASSEKALANTALQLTSPSHSLGPRS